MQFDQAVRGRPADAALAVVVGALVTTAAVFEDGTTVLDYLLIALGSLTLAAYRGAPRVVLAITTAATTAYVVHAHPGTLSALPVLGAVHTAARAGHRGVAALASAVFLAGFMTTGPGAGKWWSGRCCW